MALGQPLVDLAVASATSGAVNSSLGELPYHASSSDHAALSHTGMLQAYPSPLGICRASRKCPCQQAGSRPLPTSVNMQALSAQQTSTSSSWASMTSSPWRWVR